MRMKVFLFAQLNVRHFEFRFICCHLLAIQSINAERICRKLKIMAKWARMHLVLLGYGNPVGQNFTESPNIKPESTSDTLLDQFHGRKKSTIQRHPPLHRARRQGAGRCTLRRRYLLAEPEAYGGVVRGGCPHR